MRSLSFSIAAFLSLSCTSTGGTSGGEETGDPEQQEELITEMATTICEMKRDCGCLDEDMNTCVSDRVEGIRGVFETHLDGGLTFDPECYSENIEVVRQLGCASDGSGVEDTSCDAFVGSGQDGEECQILSTGDDTCGPGLACDNDGCKPDRPLELGEPCAAADRPAIGPCADGLYCRAEDLDDRVCAPQVGEGETCFGINQHSDCLDGLTCTGTPEMDGECVPDPDLGEACTTSGGDCQPGGWCNYDLDAPTCVPPVGPGEACDGDPGQCPEDLVCHPLDRTCTDSPPPIVCWLL